MASETLIDFETGKESHKFVRVWNERFPHLGRCFVKWNSHDFGRYPSVEIETGIGGFLPSGVEDLAIELADELELSY